ncbi:MAG TPA: DUF1501 domain-containing protein [Gemmataceae bacterium]|nr:DUF1501 domain-containing protein [Gemmataceae bacterium]
MLTLFGPKARFCDGVSRRSFLRVGALGIGAGALTLADLFRAEARAAAAGAPTPSRHKSVINVFLGGGPPHQDMWEIKTEAPAEIRGEFKPIHTKVPGVQICEVFPQLAARMDRCVVIRSVVGARGGHDAIQCLSGWEPQSLAAMGGRPSLGAVLAKVQGPVDPSVPPFVGLAAPTGHMPWSDAGRPGFLGPSYAAFKPDGPGMANLTLRGTTLDTLSDRRRLRAGFDSLRQDIDTTGTLKAVDAMTERALGVLTSSKLVEALDLSRESDKVRARYGDGKPYKYQFDGSPTCNDHLLLARRLVEAGARCVTLSYGRWDSHGKNFDLVRDHGSKLDQGLSALLDDLEVRGMLNDVSVVVWGEFGRTPRINKQAGRDHWPQVSCALLFGGGMRTGQAVGATNRLGEYASNRPVQFGEVFATLYHNLGIDLSRTAILDPTGRPQHLIDLEPMRELV